MKEKTRLFMKDSKADISGNLIYRDSESETILRFETLEELKKIVSGFGKGKHTGDIELDGSSVIVFNSIKKSSLMHLVETFSDGKINEEII